MNDLKSRFGLLRSELIYIWKPFNRLMQMGAYRFNWSLRERLRLENPGWVDAPRVEQMLRAPGARIFSGDIYARLTN
jgi:hypothetical protein